ncbi:MAG: hypothetical protein ACE5H9_06180 [Anaerolineae bacterium]
MLRFLAKVGAILLITLALLEGAAQAVWWRRDCRTLAGRELCLLPRPILSEDQVERLEKLETDPDLYHQFDPVLGWSIRPNRRVIDDGVLYQSNEIGLRAQRNYALTPPPGVTRLAVFGPSFAHGSEVSNQASWPYLLEQSQPNLEVMNWAVAGYGTDQAFLRYQTQGAAYAPHIVIIAYEEENLRRNVNRFRPFYNTGTGTPLTKPVFILSDDGLELLDNPFLSLPALRDTALNAPERFLDRVCPHDFYCVRERHRTSQLDGFKSYRFLRSLAFALKHGDDLPTYATHLLEAYQDRAQTETTLRLIYRFVETVRQNGSLPVVVTFPRRGTVEGYLRDDTPIYYEGVVQLQADGVHALDLTSFFAEAAGPEGDLSRFFAPGGHYSQAGNRLVSQALLGYLCQAGLLGPCAGP